MSPHPLTARLSRVVCAVAMLLADHDTALADEAPGAATTANPPSAAQAWCAPDLEALPNDICHVDVTPPAGGRRTLVIFLHGVIQPDSGWQWQQQRGMAAAAKGLGVSAIMPRGRRGIGPPGMVDWWTWPTSQKAQDQVEAELLDEWAKARAALEARAGKPFDEVFVFGFSNGAYYTTSLALRGRTPMDGFAAFAGGGAPKHLRDAARRAKDKKPFFLAIASKDKTTVRAAQELAKALEAVKWPHRSESLPVGHAMADRHMKHALEFLRARPAKP